MKKIALLVLVFGTETVSHGNPGIRAFSRLLRNAAVRRAACVGAAAGAAVLTNDMHVCQCKPHDYTRLEPIRTADLSIPMDDETRARVANFERTAADAQAKLGEWGSTVVVPQVQSVLQAILTGGQRVSAMQNESMGQDIHTQIQHDLAVIDHMLATAEAEGAAIQELLTAHGHAHLPIPPQTLPAAAPAA